MINSPEPLDASAVLCSVLLRTNAVMHLPDGLERKVVQGHRARIEYISSRWVWVKYQGALCKTSRIGRDVNNDHRLPAERYVSDSYAIDTVSKKATA